MKYNKNKAVEIMETKFTDYKTVKEAALEWSITTRQVIIYIERGHIPGTMKAGNLWLIPRDATQPADRRKKEQKQSGKESE